MTAVQALFVVCFSLFVGAVGVMLAIDLAAHIARYRRYRRMYPAADRGSVWRFTRD